MISIVHDYDMQEFLTEWNEDLMRVNARRGNGGNKLRTYRKFKQVFETETYIKTSMLHSRRSALAKFRCGVAPIRLETGRYEGLNVEDRLCQYCENAVECESHVLLDCVLYDDLRYFMFEGARRFHINFDSYTKDEKLSTILSDVNLTYISANFCFDILNRRTDFWYRNR